MQCLDNPSGVVIPDDIRIRLLRLGGSCGASSAGGATASAAFAAAAISLSDAEFCAADFHFFALFMIVNVFAIFLTAV